MTTSTISILPAIRTDVPTLSKIWNSSFEEDRHTEMKNQGTTPYDMEKMGNSQIPLWIASESTVVIKAVDNDTGEIMGWAVWGFHGFEKGDLPVVAGAPPPPSVEEDWKDAQLQEEPKGKKEQESKDEPEPEQPDEKDALIAKLEALTDADMERWMEKLMPPGTKCMYVITLSVAPAHQKRGAGSALLRWGTEMADKEDVFIWVHSSEGAWGAYAKSGFGVVGTLHVDLDEYAVTPPGDGTGKWGQYVFRYMKYYPKKR